MFTSLVPVPIERGKRPVSIPNLEAKPRIADDTAPFGCGKVGRRRARFFFSLSSSIIFQSFENILLQDVISLVIKFIARCDNIKKDYVLELEHCVYTIKRN